MYVVSVKAEEWQVEENLSGVFTGRMYIEAPFLYGHIGTSNFDLTTRIEL